MLKHVGALLHVEMLRLVRSRAELASSLGFVLLLITLFPFALGPDKETLQTMAGGLLALALLFSITLEGQKLYAEDKESGRLDMLRGTAVPLWLYASVRAGVQGLAFIIAFIILLPLLLLLLNTPLERFFVFAGALALGGANILLCNMALSALCLGARRAGILLPLLLFPLQIPALVFMVGAMAHGFEGAGAQAFLFLAAELLFALCVFPALAGAALKASVEAS